MADWNLDLQSFSATMVGMDPENVHEPFDRYIIQVFLGRFKWTVSRRYSYFRLIYLDLCEQYPHMRERINFPNRIPLIYAVPFLPHLREIGLGTFLHVLTKYYQNKEVKLSPLARKFFSLDKIETESIILRMAEQLPMTHHHDWMSLSRLELYSIQNHRANETSNEYTKQLQAILQCLMNLRRLTIHSSEPDDINLDGSCLPIVETLQVRIDSDLCPNLESIRFDGIEPLPELLQVEIPAGLTNFSWTKSDEAFDVDSIVGCCCRKCPTAAINELTLSHNMLERIDGQKLLALSEVLTKLDLSHNRLISYEKLSSLQQLTFLDLSHNNIESIAETTSFPHLHTLVLASNHVKRIGPTNNTYPKLRTLDLICNNILAVEDVANLVHLPSLEQLFISGNPIVTMIPEYEKLITDLIQRQLCFEKPRDDVEDKESKK